MAAKAQLSEVVRQRLAAAVAGGQRQEVVRFTKLFKPLRMQARARPPLAFSVDLGPFAPPDAPLPPGCRRAVRTHVRCASGC